MRRNQKQTTTYFILCSLLLIGVIYAILQANLQINGTAKIKSNTWDIHFDNIVINEDSVSIGENNTPATIDDNNNCKVDFEVTLSLPGDFYEFTVDVVNAGTIDGMIGELNKTLKINNEVVSEIPDYLNYSVTYDDELEIEENHKIEAGTSETYLVRLEFKTEIEELPEATTISTSLEPQYIQADSSAIQPNHSYLYNIFKLEAESENNEVKEYTQNHNDSFSKKSTQKIYYWNAANDNKAAVILDKWNVIFGGFCWQMFRTTDTGGIKLLYNGIPIDGKCTATGSSQKIGDSAFNSINKSPAYSGYMYNPDTLVSYISNQYPPSGSLFGNGVYYSEGMYTLTDTSTTYDNNHHYSCNNSSGVCSEVFYYYYNTYHVIISDGRNIIQVLTDMLSSDTTNRTNSTIKTVIDTWYQNNMISYTNKLEDIIFCNNRSINTMSGWNPNGGYKSQSLEFKTSEYNDLELECPGEIDQFSIENPKAHLIYPVGLLTSSEANLLGNNNLRTTGEGYWLASPYNFNFGNFVTRIVESDGIVNREVVDIINAVRPVVSLKPGTKFSSGDGSKNNPYIVE